MKIRKLHPGMGEAVASRTILRKGEDWPDVAKRVAAGNTGLDEGSARADYPKLRDHIANGHILMSGRHLQHGDKAQPQRPMEVFTNCSTAAASFIKFHLLLNGSGVGRVYDDDMMLVDWADSPNIVCVLSKGHPDWTEEWMDPKEVKLQHYHHHEVEDSREGWAHAFELWEYSTFLGTLRGHTIVFDFSKVRPKGAPIAGMQDRPASGPVPLMQAFLQVAGLKHKDWPRWKQAMYADHYLADCVLVGGVRRSARIAGKWWQDPGIHEFIDIKRPDELLGLHTISEIKAARAANPNMYGKLWTANNSVIVDAEFWDLVKRRDPSPLGKQAVAVFEHVCRNAYADGTGEPGFVTASSLSTKEDGLEDMPEAWFGSDKFRPKCPPGYLKALTQRFKRKKYKFFVNPCGEIVLSILGGFCVDGNTRILHRRGYDKILDLVGKKVEVFNGKEWSEVTPRQTGSDQSLVRVTLSDGSHLDCTPYHEFSVRGCRQGNTWHKKQAAQLMSGDILPTFRVPQDIQGSPLSDAYSYGVFIGDGYIENRTDGGGKRYMVSLYKGKHHLPIVGTRGSEGQNGSIKVSLGQHLNKTLMDSLNSGDLPDWLFELDRESTLEFIRGWLDTDGCYHKGIGGVSISTSIESRAYDLQLLLRRAGFSYVGVRQVYEEGDPGNWGPRTSGLWTVYIPASEAGMLNGHRVTTEYLIDLDKTVKQPRVVSVTPIEGKHDTFCFTEPKRGMGVFGNMLTYQCVIADVVPYHCETLEEAEDAFRAATRALIRVNTMPSVYQSEVRRTNRIGVGITGLHEFAYSAFGLSFRDLLDDTGVGRPFWKTLSRFSQAVRDEATAYSKQLGVAVPHTLTTIKPAGTTSKLFGLTEGCHLPAMGCYMRWVQFRNEDPIIQQYAKAGYPTQALKTFQGMTIVGFPTKPAICDLIPEDQMVFAGDATPDEQYQWLRLLEKYWLRDDTGNQISYTLKYKPSETPFEVFKDAILRNQPTVKCASVMPQMEDTSSYDYLPEDPITRQEYDDWMAVIRPIEEGEDVGREHVECAGGACPIDFK